MDKDDTFPFSVNGRRRFCHNCSSNTPIRDRRINVFHSRPLFRSAKRSEQQFLQSSISRFSKHPPNETHKFDAGELSSVFRKGRWRQDSETKILKFKLRVEQSYCSRKELPQSMETWDRDCQKGYANASKQLFGRPATVAESRAQVSREPREKNRGNP